MKNIPCIRFASSLFFVVVRSNALSLDLDTTEPEGNPEGRGRNPYFHTHTHTHTHKHFSVSSLFHLNFPPTLPLLSPFVFLLLLVVSSSSLSYLLLPLSPSLVPDRGDDKTTLNGDKQP